NIVDIELAGIDVRQYEIRFASRVDRRDPRELPIQPDRADESSASELVVTDVVDFQSSRIGVAQQQIGFAGDAAEVTDARELPIEPHGADEGCIGDLAVRDVVDLQSAGIGIAQKHVAFAETAEIADTRELPV